MTGTSTSTPTIVTRATGEVVPLEVENRQCRAGHLKPVQYVQRLEDPLCFGRKVPQLRTLLSSHIGDCDEWLGDEVQLLGIRGKLERVPAERDTTVKKSVEFNLWDLWGSSCRLLQLLSGQSRDRYRGCSRRYTRSRRGSNLRSTLLHSMEKVCS